MFVYILFTISRCINLSDVVPTGKVEEVESVFFTHAKWMDEFYSTDNGWERHLISFFLQKHLNSMIQLIPAKAILGKFFIYNK
jgi:hypothetical protein